MNKNNFFSRFQKDKNYQRLLREEGEILDIAIQIALARKKKNLTQVQLAKRVGMPQSQIARIESGNHNVTLGTLYRVAGALDLRVRVAE